VNAHASMRCRQLGWLGTRQGCSSRHSSLAAYCPMLAHGGSTCCMTGSPHALSAPAGREPVLGVHTAAAPAAAATAPAAAAPSPAAVPTAAPAAAAQLPAQAAPAAPHQQVAAADAPPAQQQQQQQQQQAAAPVPAAPALPAATATAAAAAAAPGGPAAAASADDAPPSVARFARRGRVCTRRAEKEADAGASAGAGNEDDAFFEFTEVRGGCMLQAQHCSCTCNHMPGACRRHAACCIDTTNYPLMHATPTVTEQLQSIALGCVADGPEARHGQPGGPACQAGGRPPHDCGGRQGPELQSWMQSDDAVW